MKISEYANVIKKITAKELGHIQCGYDNRENLEINNIKSKVRKEMVFSNFHCEKSIFQVKITIFKSKCVENQIF